MKNTPKSTMNEFVPILSISPTEEDHSLLQDILNGVEHTLDSNCSFSVSSAATLGSALAALRKQRFAIVVCERDLHPGSWKDLLQQVSFLLDPPSVIMTSWLADERLWAEALNLGAYDVLAKPFDMTEVRRVVCGAWRAWRGSVPLSAGQEDYRGKAATAEAS